MQALASLVFTSGLAHVLCNTVQKSDEPNAENDIILTCSSPNASCADFNSAPGIKKGRANVLLQSHSEMTTKDCEFCDGSKCWDDLGNKKITSWAGDNVVIKMNHEEVDSTQACVMACKKKGGKTIQMQTNRRRSSCTCLSGTWTGESSLQSGYTLYEKAASGCTTTTTTTWRSCAANNDCEATTEDPTCGNECEEFATAGTCCQTCDETSDARRRDSRRRRDSNGKGYLCQRRRG